MKITLDPPGQRPNWLKDEDVVLSRHWRRLGPDYTQEPAKKLLWEVPALLAIEIEDTHPYAVATSKGFTYWPGGESAPEDWDSSGPILFRNGDITTTHGNWTWLHDGRGYDIIGYPRKAEEAGKVWYLPIKSRDIGPYVGAIRKRLVDARSFFSEGDHCQILALTISPSGKLLSAEVVQPPSRIDEIRAEMDALRAELERLGCGS